MRSTTSKIPQIVFGFLIALLSGVSWGDSAQSSVAKTNSYDLSNPEVQMKLAFVHTLLVQTRRKHSHQLNGATGNQYYLRKTDGAEAVFDKEGNLVSDCVNKTVANSVNPMLQPLAHFSLDVLPWLQNGNCKAQVIPAEKRVNAYIRDLRDSLNLSTANGGGFYLPEFPDLMTVNFKGFFLFTTQLERHGFELKKFIQHDYQDVKQRELFLALMRNILLSEISMI